MRHEKYENSTELAKYVWSLKRSNTAYEIGWTIKERARSYSNVSGKCNLCISEKFQILKAAKSQALNQRSEMISSCRHDRKYLLAHSVT